jgi:hypothetical protein
LKQPQQTSAIINFVYRFTKTEDKFAIEWITHYLFRRQLTWLNWTPPFDSIGRFPLCGTLSVDGTRLYIQVVIVQATNWGG